MARRPLVAVFGSSTIREPGTAWAEAEELGRRLAEAGADVITGGYGGAMEACSRGAHAAGGHVVGVTVEIFEPRGPVNRYVRERVHTPDLFERLRHILNRADAFVAVSGSVGTITEVLLTWNLLLASARPRAPLVLLGACWKGWLEAHREPDLVLPELFEYVRLAATPEEAVRLALEPPSPS